MTYQDWLWSAGFILACAIALTVRHWLAKRAEAKRAIQRAADKAEQKAAEELLDAEQAASDRLETLHLRANRLMNAPELAEAPAWYPQNLREQWTEMRAHGLEAGARMLANLPADLKQIHEAIWREGHYYEQQQADDRRVLEVLAALDGILPALARRQAALVLYETVTTAIGIMDEGLASAERNGFMEAHKERQNFDAAAALARQALIAAEEAPEINLDTFLAALCPMIDVKGALVRLQYAMHDQVVARRAPSVETADGKKPMLH